MMKNTLKRAIKKFITNDAGFTLIEMSLVLFIISVLLLLIIPNIGSHQGTAQETGNEALEIVVQTQIDLYEMEIEKKPATLSELQTAGFLSKSQLEKVQEQFELDSSGNLVKIGGE